jgi:hypothetical protein
MTDAEFELGYRPVTTYERAVVPVCEWLVETLSDRAWEEAIPGLKLYMGNAFDYEAEDELVRALATAG